MGLGNWGVLGEQNRTQRLFFYVMFPLDDLVDLVETLLFIS